jgi:hypothetical protein
MNKKAEVGLKMLKEAVLEWLDTYPMSRNSDIAKGLDLCTSHEGASTNYLTYSILGELMKESKISKIKQGNSTYYIIKQH